MDTHLTVGKIHIIEWLSAGDWHTGRELFNEIQPMGLMSARKIEVEFHSVGSRVEFSTALRAIQENFRVTNRIPFLQIESHGIYIHDPRLSVADGIGATDSEMLQWDELAQELVMLNQMTGLRLGIMTASCSGLWGIRAVQVVDRAPFLAIIGPNRSLNAGEVFDASRAFYDAIFRGESGDQAIKAMNTAVLPKPLTFGAYNCEKLFKDVFEAFLNRMCVEPALTQWVDRMDARRSAQFKAERGVGRWKHEIAHDRDLARRYLEDYQTRFQEFRRHFFMIDLFPENDGRFNLTVTRVNAAD
jgi:hypothetical protein